MYIPEDLIFKILSYIEYDEFQNFKLQFKYYLGYFSSRFNEKISAKWIYGIYKNYHNLCFNCYKPLESKFIIVLCMDCEVNIDNHFSFPITCTYCNQIKHIKKNIMFSSNCVNCEKKTVHLIGNKYY